VSNERNAAVSAGRNGDWGVAWESEVNSATTLKDIYFSRVSATGAVLDHPASRLSWDTPAAEKFNETIPDVAWNGARYLAVWEGRGAYPLIGAAMVAGDGTVTCRQCHAVGSIAESPVGDPAVAAGGGKFMIVYEYNSDQFTNGVDIESLFVENEEDFSFGPTVTSQPGHEQEPAITYNGTFLVTWRDRRKKESGDIYGTRVKALAHAVEDPGGFLVTEYYKTNGYPALAPGAGAGTYVVSWQATPAGSGSGIISYGMKFGQK
jgi:hypothetical protein